MQKKVLIIALGDVYWTRFARHFSRSASEAGITSVIALESRLGEYQAYRGRADYTDATTYYLTDHAEKGSNAQLISNECVSPVMCDYLRMSLLGQNRARQGKNWANIAAIIRGFVNNILDKESIDLIIGDTVSTALSYTFNQEALVRGIPYWGLSGSRLPSRHITSYTISHEADIVHSYYKKILNETQPISQEEREWAESYLETIDTQVPDYMKSPMLNSVSLKKFANTRYANSILGSILYTIKERTDQKNILARAGPFTGIITAARRNLARLLKANLVTRYYTSLTETQRNRQYFLYPIHYQPEASTVVGSPFHTDQLNLLKNLAFSMPKGSWLYVKEHLSNYGFPSINFYKEITALPNVLLIDHREDTKSLIRKSQAVITLTSTAGFEALLLNKPVLHFGDVFYTYHPNAIRLESWRDIPRQLENLTIEPEVDNRAFLVAYRRYTQPGTIDFTKPDFGILSALMKRVTTTLSKGSAGKISVKVP